MEFSEKKNVALERRRVLQEEISRSIVDLQSKRDECAEISRAQYDLEMKTAVGLMNTKTGKRLTETVRANFGNFARGRGPTSDL